jgi:hypothetical protein
MNEALKAKIAAALANPNVPIDLTPEESAELDAYMALVLYFESVQTGGHA